METWSLQSKLQFKESNQPFSFLLGVCNDLFGYTHDQMADRISANRRTYAGSDGFDAKNVVFTYGDYDVFNPASYHGESKDDRLSIPIDSKLNPSSS